MTKLLQILWLLFFVACKNEVSHHTDLKEYGLKGKIKKITTFNYEDIILKGDEWQPVDTSVGTFKTEIVLNKNGNIELLSTGSMARNSASLPQNVTSTYSYENGMKSGKHYENGIEKGTISYEWTDKKSYKIISYNKSGKILFTSKIQLTDSFRDSSGEFRLFDGGDTLVYGHTYENILDSENRLVRGIRTDLKSKERKETNFTYKQLDKSNNPLIIYLSYEKGDKPYRISLRTYEYY